MAYYSQNGTGIDSNAYIYVQLQVTRTDYDTYSHFDLKSVAVSDTGTSGFIRGQVTTNQGGTSWTASTGWKDVYYNGTTTLATSSFNINRGSSDGTVRCGAYAEGGGSGIYAGGTDYAWLNVTVPKVESPNAPSNCSASYVSDSSASVSWANGSTTTAKPRTATLVERQTDGGSWVQVATLGSSVTNWTDNGISANHSYLYRVRAQNSIEYSAYSTAPSMIFTTPAAPSDVLLDKMAATTVQLDVTGTWGYAVTYDVESTYDGGSTWASVATSTSLPYSATVSAGTVQFRVRAVRGALSSAWTNSASLVTVCPPLAPTIVSAPSGSIANGSTATVSWTPNHPDGSTQSAAQVKVTYPGGSSTTFGVTTATSWTSNALTANGAYTVQVRTKGLDPSYGEWSQTVSWGVYNPPAVVITSPATDGTDVVSLPMTVSWSVTDSTGVSAQRIIIEGSDGEILNRTLAGDVRTVALNASDVALENGQTYTIRLRVMGGSGLVTEQTRIFDVAWLAPAAPVLQLTEGEGRSATIDVMDTHYSESGSTISVDGSAIADSFTVFGKSTQDGTPTPSAPVPIVSVADGGTLNVKTKDSANVTTVYPIDLQGNALRSLPDGTRDELQVGERVTLVKRVGVVVGSDLTQYNSSNGYIAYQTGVIPSACKTVTEANNRVLCSWTTTSEFFNSSNMTKECVQFPFGTIAGNIRVYVAALQGRDVSDFLFLYPLATPQEIDLGAASDYPFIPDDGEMWVDGTTMEAVLRPADYAGQPTIESVTVQRVNPDGTLWTVASGLQSGDTCIDPLPPLGVDYTYRAVASAASGATSSKEVSNRLGGCRWALNFGQAASACKLVGRNPSSSVSYEHGGELYHFARGFQNPEDMLPEFYPVGSIDANATLEFDAETRDEAKEIMALMFQYPVAWLRTPFGERRRVRVKPTYNLDRRTKRITVSYDLIRFGEAW